ncbi:hypothetical protein VUR80DRAFT_8673 [Thermomyces stellatus]
MTLAVHTYLGILWRTWGFMAFMVVGCVYVILGWFASPGSPAFFTAAIYVTLSRAINFFSLEISRLPPRVSYWVFTSADILCLVLQAIGGTLSSASKGSSQISIDIATAGLILQVVVLVTFCAVFADLHGALPQAASPLVLPARFWRQLRC